MALNAARHIRDAVYLDTNAWSMLAKGDMPIEPLAAWVQQSNCVLWMARMQLAELAARPDIIKGVADTIEKIPVVIIDRGVNDLHGLPWHSVPVNLRQPLHLTTPALKAEFIDQFSGSLMIEARDHLATDRDRFRAWLQQALLVAAQSSPKGWSAFPERVKNWIRQMCTKNGCNVVEDALENPECYAGARLSFAVLFSRYLVNGQGWRESDYLDYLHAADMAYAKIVVTERNMAECIRQALRRPEVSGPELTVETDWLRAPHGPP
ncbi:hypothetical protein [Sorangium sp. So ce117]|uniref:hypothetical protein n=1 Tax=Sorangium sp. So ce117 TaxID=3133277 RepID=UPI003F60523E